MMYVYDAIARDIVWKSKGGNGRDVCSVLFGWLNLI